MEKINTVKEFAKIIKENLDTICTGCSISIKDIRKNNDTEYTAFMFMDSGCSAAPLIYLDGYFEDYMNGRGIEDITAEIQKVYSTFDLKPGYHMENITDYNYVKDKICFRLINMEKNRKFLSDVPHIPFLDLAVIFYVSVSFGTIHTGTAVVHNSLMERWENPDIESLFCTARENTQRLFKGCITDIKNIIGGFKPETDADDIQMYVATNRANVNGAGVILYDGLLHDFSQKLGGAGFFILPSSIHEVILVPEYKDMDAGNLLKMVHEVNKTVLSPEELLSDNIYKYTAADGRISAVSNINCNENFPAFMLAGMKKPGQ